MKNQTHLSASFSLQNKHAERLKRFSVADLYLVTSQPLSAGRTTLEIVKAALNAGVKLIQLREKELSTAELTILAREVKKLAAAAGALLIINDRIDVALAVAADGVHLGQDDFPVDDAREIAPDLLIGVSTHTIEEAQQAQLDGASYVNIGPLFPTQTKAWSDKWLGIDGMKKIAAVIHIPFSVMGGIKTEHIPDLVINGAATIAMVTAVTAAPDPASAASDILTCIKSAKGSKASY